MAKRNLIKILKDNPGCVAIIDNDYWRLYRVHPSENPFDIDDTDVPEREQEKLWKNYDKWEKKNELASSSDTFSPKLGDGGYGSGHCYGGDIMQAMAMILGVKLESV
jgi:hypothetical protein